MAAILREIRPGLFDELFAWSLLEGWGDDAGRTAEICRQIHIANGCEPERVKLEMFIHEPRFEKPADESKRRQNELKAIEAQIDARLKTR